MPPSSPALGPESPSALYTQLHALAAEPDQRDAATRTLEFLRAHPDAFERTCAPGHITGSAFVVDPPTGRFVVLLHAKLGRWFQPGGHADGETIVSAVALREASEETGIDGLVVDPDPIDVDIHEVAPPGEPPHLHYDIRYLVRAPDGHALEGNHESLDIRWVDEHDLAALGADPGLHRLARRGARRLVVRPGAD